MLAYAFRSLKIGSISNMGSEVFENLHELFAEIIIHGMLRQVKRGLPMEYKNENEELANLRGKIDIQSSIRKQTQVRHKLVCEFDEFTDDTASNRLIKYAVTHLLRNSNVSYERKRFLKFIRSCLNSVLDIQYRPLLPQRTGSAEYIMLVNICCFLLDGLIINTGGSTKMRDWLRNEEMSLLYERFLLEYFKYHHPEFNACSSHIEWDAENLPLNMPKMKSDVYLTYGTKTLIIDAKFYSHTMSEHFGKKIYHSYNLYQIFTYVKNADRKRNGEISGMLLYAMTDDEITPDSDVIISGNGISIKTLDLSKDFTNIKFQLENIAGMLV